MMDAIAEVNIILVDIVADLQNAHSFYRIRQGVCLMKEFNEQIRSWKIQHVGCGIWMKLGMHANCVLTSLRMR